MRILFDTNIFIYRENNQILPLNLQLLIKRIQQRKISILLHPKSIEDLKNDSNSIRQNISLSKLNTYQLLESPPNHERDKWFLKAIGYAKKSNDAIDNDILYSIYRNCADFLVTEDMGIHKKASRIGVKDRVLTIDEALVVFQDYLVSKKINHLPALKDDFVYNLDIKDPFFDSLKDEYNKVDFEKWFQKISREGRKCLVHFKEDKKIGALLIYKIENETIDSNPILATKKRLKISTFKVTYTGQKIGELFIKIAVRFSVDNNIDEMYLTHFNKPVDYFVDLITEYGFCNVATLNHNEESVYVKKLIVDKSNIKPNDIKSISKKFYPSYYDGKNVNKFIVPILPKWHERLFTEYKTIAKMGTKGRQPTLIEFNCDFIVEGNTIEKAYLCHSNSRKASKNDILLFYRSADEKAITSIGVIDEIYYNVQDKEEILRHVGKRSVYSIEEIEEAVERPTTVILFTWHFHLPNPISRERLISENVIKWATQSLTEISDDNYRLIKNEGKIDGRFTIN